MSDEAPAPDLPPPADIPALLRDIVADLQVSPMHYRLFGIWWWPVKAILRRAGFTRANALHLGGYTDPEVAALVPEADLAETLRAAVEEYQFNSVFPRADGVVETEDGDLVRIWDGDVEA